MNHNRLSVLFVLVFIGLLALLSPIAIGAQENTPYLPASPASVMGTAFPTRAG